MNNSPTARPSYLPADANPVMAIVAHGQFAATYETNKSRWYAHRLPLVTYFPKTAPEGERPNFPVPMAWSEGDASSSEPLSTPRFRRLLRLLLEKTGGTHFLIYGYNTVSLDARLPEWLFERKLLWGKFPDQLADPSMEVQQPIPSFPLFADRKTLATLHNALIGLSDKETDAYPAELSIWNMAVAQVIKNGDVKHGNLGPSAFARDPRIEQTDEFAAAQAAQNGAIWFHGVFTTASRRPPTKQFPEGEPYQNDRLLKMLEGSRTALHEKQHVEGLQTRAVAENQRRFQPNANDAYQHKGSPMPQEFIMNTPSGPVVPTALQSVTSQMEGMQGTPALPPSPFGRTPDNIPPGFQTPQPAGVESFTPIPLPPPKPRVPVAEPQPPVQEAPEAPQMASIPLPPAPKQSPKKGGYVKAPQPEPATV